MDWARQKVGIKGAQRNLQQENIELMKQIYVWKAKFEMLQYVFLFNDTLILLNPPEVCI